VSSKNDANNEYMERAVKVSIHQPETYPQLGYFNKIYESDAFVFLDNVAFRKNYFQNRNRISGKEGEIWLTLPVSGGKLIQEKSYERKLVSKHLKSIRNVYGAGEAQDQLCNLIESVDQIAEGNLSEFNISFTVGMCEILGINADFMRSSTLNTSCSKSDLVLEICKKLGACIYLSGTSGRDYLSLPDFEERGVQIWFQEFNYPFYKQKGPVFNRYASVIDSICNNGIGATAEFIKNSNWKKSHENHTG